MGLGLPFEGVMGLFNREAGDEAVLDFSTRVMVDEELEMVRGERV